MQVDHLIVGAPDLEQASRFLEKILGVKPIPGGSHQGFGTRNALLGLGPGCYLELLAPDPEQEPPVGGYWMNVDQRETPHLIRWAARSLDINADMQKAAEHGVDLGQVLPGNRRKMDGTVLRWQLSNPQVDPANGIVPFFIDWGDGPHPADELPQAGTLIQLNGKHPELAQWQPFLSTMNLPIELSASSKPSLSAEIQLLNGETLLLT